jgi:hypothetical protein
MDGWMGGWTDGWMDGRMGIETYPWQARLVVVEEDDGDRAAGVRALRRKTFSPLDRVPAEYCKARPPCGARGKPGRSQSAKAAARADPGADVSGPGEPIASDAGRGEPISTAPSFCCEKSCGRRPAQDRLAEYPCEYRAEYPCEYPSGTPRTRRCTHTHTQRTHARTHARTQAHAHTQRAHTRTQRRSHTRARARSRSAVSAARRVRGMHDRLDRVLAAYSKMAWGHALGGTPSIPPREYSPVLASTHEWVPARAGRAR